MSLARALPESFARAELGQYGMSRLVVAESPSFGEFWRGVVAVEVAHHDGPFVHPEDLHRLNLYARVTHDLGPRSELSFAWMSYGSTWNGSGHATYYWR
jgi:hypothetical protein